MTGDLHEALLGKVQAIVAAGSYAIRPHAVRHSIEEGFEEPDILEAISTARMLEIYPDEARCLLVGTYKVAAQVNQFLHVVVDFWAPEGDIDWVDVVTAYIPQRPHWESPRKRGGDP